MRQRRYTHSIKVNIEEHMLDELSKLQRESGWHKNQIIRNALIRILSDYRRLGIGPFVTNMQVSSDANPQP